MNPHQSLFKKPPSRLSMVMEYLPVILLCGGMLLCMAVLIWCTTTIALSHEMGVI